MELAELDIIKSNLLAQKSAILNKTSELREQSIITNDVSDEADQAAQDLSLSIAINLHERDRITLFKIEKALSRLGSGSYHLCEACGCDISLKRLKANPFSNLCIDCQEERENFLK